MAGGPARPFTRRRTLLGAVRAVDHRLVIVGEIRARAARVARHRPTLVAYEVCLAVDGRRSSPGRSAARASCEGSAAQSQFAQQKDGLQVVSAWIPRQAPGERPDGPWRERREAPFFSGGDEPEAHGVAEPERTLRHRQPSIGRSRCKLEPGAHDLPTRARPTVCSIGQWCNGRRGASVRLDTWGGPLTLWGRRPTARLSPPHVSPSLTPVVDPEHPASAQSPSSRAPGWISVPWLQPKPEMDSAAFQESLHAPRTPERMNEVLFRLRRRRILRGWARGRLDYSDAWRQLQRLMRG